MKIKTCVVLLTNALFLFGIVHTQEIVSDFPVLKGPYLGQKPPGMTPELFAPDIFSMGIHTFSTAFTPCGNEVYFSRFVPEKKIDQIMVSKRINDIWTKPETVSFSGIYNENDVRITTDGYRMFFRSRRPLTDFKKQDDHYYIWYVNRNNDGTWSDMQPLKCGGAYLRTGDIGISNIGTLYFAYRKNDTLGIYRSKFVNGVYDEPEFVITATDSEGRVGDTYIAPDESYLIVSCWYMPQNKGQSDLYISFQKMDGSWTPLKNMGEPINTDNNENCSALSPEGKYFFYLSVGDESQTFWVDSKVIDNLKPDHHK